MTCTSAKTRVASIAVTTTDTTAVTVTAAELQEVELGQGEAGLLGEGHATHVLGQERGVVDVTACMHTYSS